VIEMFHPVREDLPAEGWDDGRKQEVTASAIRTLRQIHDLDIAVARVRTPKDFLEGLHLYRGALYGLSPTVGPREFFAHRSPIPGLFLAGQSTYPGCGIGPSVMLGIFAAEALMGGKRADADRLQGNTG